MLSNRVQIWCQEIEGISCYIDDKWNIYVAEDVVSKRVPIRIAGKYIKTNEIYKFSNV